MINVMYYDTMVLIRNNYFCHQISEVVHLPWVYVDSCICHTDLVAIVPMRERDYVHM